MRLIGLDPGLRATGWGIIEARDNRLRHVASGVVRPDPAAETPLRLAQLFEGVKEILARHGPDEAAVEEIFVNTNPASTLKLGQARGVVLLAPALLGIAVHEYAARLVKKSVVGSGRAEKAQVQAMVRMLLPGSAPETADAADALAAAICHAHHRGAPGSRTEAAVRPVPAAPQGAAP